MRPTSPRQEELARPRESFEAQVGDPVACRQRDPESVTQTIRRLTITPSRESGCASVRRGQRKLGDNAVRCHSSNNTTLGEPDVSIRTDGDIDWRPGLTRDRELR